MDSTGEKVIKIERKLLDLAWKTTLVPTLKLCHVRGKTSMLPPLSVSRPLHFGGTKHVIFWSVYWSMLFFLFSIFLCGSGDLLGLWWFKAKSVNFKSHNGQPSLASVFFTWMHEPFSLLAWAFKNLVLSFKLGDAQLFWVRKRVPLLFYFPTKWNCFTSKWDSSLVICHLS